MGFVVIKSVLLYTPMHVATMTLWIILRVASANRSHCGYNFSWTPEQLFPFYTHSEFHDYHHTKNVGNFSTHFIFWDVAFNTSGSYVKYRAKKALMAAKKND
jgi:sterol desaturase/sphingolipid hydroxylase (fatty acid hydroxylase superfamily)